MANHKSAEKRHRQSLKRRDRNRAARSAVRTIVKKARAAIEAGDESKLELLRKAESAISKAATKGLIPVKTGSRQISRLVKSANKEA